VVVVDQVVIFLSFHIV